jgi:hypothetical protein
VIEALDFDSGEIVVDIIVLIAMIVFWRAVSYFTLVFIAKKHVANA